MRATSLSHMVAYEGGIAQKYDENSKETECKRHRCWRVVGWRTCVYFLGGGLREGLNVWGAEICVSLGMTTK